MSPERCTVTNEKGFQNKSNVQHPLCFQLSACQPAYNGKHIPMYFLCLATLHVWALCWYYMNIKAQERYKALIFETLFFMRLLRVDYEGIINMISVCFTYDIIRSRIYIARFYHSMKELPPYDLKTVLERWAKVWLLLRELDKYET